MDAFWQALLNATVFSFLGIVMAMLGFKIFDWLTPRMKFEEELAQKQNIAVAIVVGAMILGICFIVGMVVH